MQIAAEYFDQNLQFHREVWIYAEGEEPRPKFAHPPLSFVHGVSDRYQDEGPNIFGLDWPGEPPQAVKVLKAARRGAPNVSALFSYTIPCLLGSSALVEGFVLGYPLELAGGEPGRCRYYFSGGTIIEAGCGELVVVRHGEPVRLMGERHRNFEPPSDLEADPCWYEGLRQALAWLDAESRQALSRRAGGHFDFTPLASGHSDLVDAPYLLGRTTIGELRSYFGQKYALAPMFNAELDERLRCGDEPVSETQSLIAQVGCESNFVVLYGEVAGREGDRLKAVDLRLLDGFIKDRRKTPSFRAGMDRRPIFLESQCGSK